MRKILFSGKLKDSEDLVYWNMWGFICDEEGNHTSFQINECASASLITGIAFMIDENTIEIYEDIDDGVIF